VACSWLLAAWFKVKRWAFAFIAFHKIKLATLVFVEHNAGLFVATRGKTIGQCLLSVPVCGDCSILTTAYEKNASSKGWCVV